MTGFIIWVIGSGFTVGFCVDPEESALDTAMVSVLVLFFWPVILGDAVSDIFKDKYHDIQDE